MPQRHVDLLIELAARFAIQLFREHAGGDPVGGNHVADAVGVQGRPETLRLRGWDRGPALRAVDRLGKYQGVEHAHSTILPRRASSRQRPSRPDRRNRQPGQTGRPEHPGRHLPPGPALGPRRPFRRRPFSRHAVPVRRAAASCCAALSAARRPCPPRAAPSRRAFPPRRPCPPRRPSPLSPSRRLALRAVRDAL